MDDDYRNSPVYVQLPPYLIFPRPPISAFAVVSMVMGLLWFFWIGSAVAIVTGIFAVREIRNRGYRGLTAAVTGLCLGSVGAVTLLLTLISMMFSGSP